MDDIITGELLRFYFKDIVENFERHPTRKQHVNDMFGKNSVRDIEDTCDFFCPECEQMLSCEGYWDTMEDWEGMYS